MTACPYCAGTERAGSKHHPAGDGWCYITYGDAQPPIEIRPRLRPGFRELLGRPYSGRPRYSCRRDDQYPQPGTVYYGHQGWRAFMDGDPDDHYHGDDLDAALARAWERCPVEERVELPTCFPCQHCGFGGEYDYGPRCPACAILPAHEPVTAHCTKCGSGEATLVDQVCDDEQVCASRVPQTQPLSPDLHEIATIGSVHELVDGSRSTVVHVRDELDESAVTVTSPDGRAYTMPLRWWRELRQAGQERPESEDLTALRIERDKYMAANDRAEELVTSMKVERDQWKERWQETFDKLRAEKDGTEPASTPAPVASEAAEPAGPWPSLSQDEETALTLFQRSGTQPSDIVAAIQKVREEERARAGAGMRQLQHQLEAVQKELYRIRQCFRETRDQYMTEKEAREKAEARVEGLIEEVNVTQRMLDRENADLEKAEARISELKVDLAIWKDGRNYWKERCDANLRVYEARLAQLEAAVPRQPRVCMDPHCMDDSDHPEHS